MKREEIVSLIYVLFVLIAVGLPQAIADGDNDNLTTTVTVSNSAPTVGAITCPSSLTPTAETTVTLNCNATVTDLNGYQDLAGVRAEFYNDSLGASANYTKHYNNATCILTDNVTTTSVAKCTFNIYYHASPVIWTIYFNATDSSGSTGSSTNTVTVNQLTALNVTNTSIPFGSVSLGAQSSEITTAIKNTGNVNIDLNINESLYGGQMACNGVGSANITTDAASTGVRYNLTSGFNFDTAPWKLTESNDLRDVNFTKSYVGTGTATPPQYNLYWLIKLPASGISGTCTTTTRISAAASS